MDLDELSLLALARKDSNGGDERGDSELNTRQIDYSGFSMERAKRLIDGGLYTWLLYPNPEPLTKGPDSPFCPPLPTSDQPYRLRIAPNITSLFDFFWHTPFIDLSLPDHLQSLVLSSSSITINRSRYSLKLACLKHIGCCSFQQNDVPGSLAAKAVPGESALPSVLWCHLAVHTRPEPETTAVG